MKSSELSNNKIITLLTDFGYADPFVGQMKGVILSINPKATIIDITHDIKGQDIEEASFILWNSYRYFPKGTIHIAVVDPGVGSKRKAIIAEIDNHYFLFPDNGLISYVIKDKRFRAFKVENKQYMLRQNSPTFQGRDLFATAAAWLSKGEAIENFGKAVKKLTTFPIEEPGIIKEKNTLKIVGKVIHIDKFGNAITNIKISSEKLKEVKIRDISLPIVKCYSENKKNPAALINSDDFIEIFIYKGNVSKTLNITKNSKVEVIIDG